MSSIHACFCFQHPVENQPRQACGHCRPSGCGQVIAAVYHLGRVGDGSGISGACKCKGITRNMPHVQWACIFAATDICTRVISDNDLRKVINSITYIFLVGCSDSQISSFPWFSCLTWPSMLLWTALNQSHNHANTANGSLLYFRTLYCKFDRLSCVMFQPTIVMIPYHEFKVEAHCWVYLVIMYCQQCIMYSYVISSGKSCVCCPASLDSECHPPSQHPLQQTVSQREIHSLHWGLCTSTRPQDFTSGRSDRNWRKGNVIFLTHMKHWQ